MRRQNDPQEEGEARKCFGAEPGAARRASLGAEMNATKVSAQIETATQKKTLEKNLQPSSSSSSKYLVRKGIRVIEK